MQRVKLKQRILVPFVIASLFLFVLSLLGIHAEESEHMDADFMFSVEGMQESYKALLRHDANGLQTALEFIVQDTALKTAFRAGDRSELLKVARPLFERLRANNDVTHFYFHDAERTNVLRVHRPDRYGDTIDRFTALEAERSGRLNWGVEFGPLGTFALRAVMPWWDNGQVLGYIELGEEVEQGSQELASMFNMDLFVLISKQHLVQEEWETGMRMLDRSHDWDLLSDWVVSYQTLANLSPILLRSLVNMAKGEQTQIIQASHNGAEYRGAFISLEDAGHRRVAKMLVLRNMTARLDSTFHSLVGIFGVAFVVGITLFGLFYIILSRVESQLAGHQLQIEKEGQARLEIQAEHVRELERLALFDPLTGLPNRRSLDRWLTEVISDPAKAKRGYVLILLNLEQMREINNTLGHETGDKVLIMVAERLKAGVPEADIIASFGGNEFALFLPAPPPELQGAPIEKLKELFKAPFTVSDTSLAVSATAGVVRFPEHGDEASLLIRRADVAMRQAKQLKKGCELYDSSRDPYSMRRLTLASDLHKAIESGDLMLHYQPQIEVESRRIAGVEALARWNHPEHGAISPGEFIPLAEGAGLIGPLTLSVLDQALGQCAEWVKGGLDIKVSVNMSAQNLIDASFPEKVAALLLQRQLDPGRLILEVTESVFMLEPEHSLAMLDRLKLMGIGLSIDDFGTGYSSLAYLKRLPVGELKIDQGFVFDMLDDENDAKIVSSTVSLAHGLGLKVVAEGVESKEVWDNLAALDCDIIQGYYVAKPMPPEELVAWLDSSNQYKAAG
ncbi:putative bifunctional diguanylate cyclase/phosphodiesterase [Pseudomonadota bacterium]